MRMECRNCKKPEVDYRKGLWSPDEDEKLRDYILKHGVSCWSAIAAKAGLQRNGKSCRLRWINYLRPGLKRGNFSPEEEELILKLQSKIGNKWSQIAMHLPGRTDNEVKNYWNSYLKKKITKAQDSGTPTTATSALNLTIQRLSKSEQSDHFISSAGSTEALESCQSSLESVIHSTGVGFPKGITSDHPPKVSFADWLPFDHANWGSLFSLEDVISNQWHCKNSYTEEIYRPRSSQVDAQLSNDIVSNSFKFTNTCGEFK